MDAQRTRNEQLQAALAVIADRITSYVTGDWHTPDMAAALADACVELETIFSEGDPRTHGATIRRQAAIRMHRLAESIHDAANDLTENDL